MAVKHIVLPDGTHRLFGRKKPTGPTTRPRLKDYLMADMPTPPTAAGYSAKARPQLHEIYGNDSLGDCVEACIAHAVGVFGANAQEWWTFSTEQIVQMYSSMGGYVPGDPSTDNGTDISTALDIWKSPGVVGPGGTHQIAGSLAVNAADPIECRMAIWLFENLVLGLDLPDAWINPFPSYSGFIWDVAGAPDPNNGHCVVANAYDTANICIATWAMNGAITNAAMEEYLVPSNGGELYTVLSRDVIDRATERCPAGFNFGQLQADFAAL